MKAFAATVECNELSLIGFGRSAQKDFFTTNGRSFHHRFSHLAQHIDNMRDIVALANSNGVQAEIN